MDKGTGGRRTPKPSAGFLRSESGAVSVDWVVLSAAILGICIGLFASVETGIATMGGTLGSGLSNASVVELGALGWSE